MNDESLAETGRLWLKARDIIAEVLVRLRPDLKREVHEHNAATILARLAHAEPPILICTSDELKD